jgi:hypothetical protein
MCKFCYNIGNKTSNKKVYWNARSHICVDKELVEYEDVCEEFFLLEPYRYENGDLTFSIEHYLETNDGKKLHSFSELCHWLYCPFCGKKISFLQESDVNNYWVRGMKIEDDEWETYASLYGKDKEPWN